MLQRIATSAATTLRDNPIETGNAVVVQLLMRDRRIRAHASTGEKREGS